MNQSYFARMRPLPAGSPVDYDFSAFAESLGISQRLALSVYLYARQAAKHAAKFGLLPRTLTTSDLANAAFLHVCERGNVPDDKIMRRRIWRAIRSQCARERDQGLTGRFDGRSWQAQGVQAPSFASDDHAVEVAGTAPEFEIDPNEIRDRLRAACRDNRLTDREVALAVGVLPINAAQTVLSIADCAREATLEFDCRIAESDVIASVAKLCEIAGILHGLDDTRSAAQKRLDTMRDRGVKCGPRA